MCKINASVMSDVDLQDYDEMMTRFCVGNGRISALGIAVWIDVLNELDLRGQVALISGSYDDIGNAQINRKWM
jgi:hypothetical protein